MFFFPKKYDLGQVGRYRLDKQFNLNNSGNDSVLTHDDFLITLKYRLKKYSRKKFSKISSEKHLKSSSSNRACLPALGGPIR